jgi:hypothetical protein
VQNRLLAALGRAARGFSIVIGGRLGSVKADRKVAAWLKSMSMRIAASVSFCGFGRGPCSVEFAAARLHGSEKR